MKVGTAPLFPFQSKAIFSSFMIVSSPLRIDQIPREFRHAKWKMGSRVEGLIEFQFGHMTRLRVHLVRSLRSVVRMNTPWRLGKVRSFKGESRPDMQRKKKPNPQQTEWFGRARTQRNYGIVSFSNIGTLSSFVSWTEVQLN